MLYFSHLITRSLFHFAFCVTTAVLRSPLPQVIRIMHHLSFTSSASACHANMFCECFCMILVHCSKYYSAALALPKLKKRKIMSTKNVFINFWSCNFSVRTLFFFVHLLFCFFVLHMNPNGFWMFNFLWYF